MVGNFLDFYSYKVIRATPQLPAQYETLLALANQDKYDFWQDPRPNGPADIMVSPTDEHEVIEHLISSGISYEIMIPNVETVLQEERLRKMKQAPLKHAEMDWEEYHTWDEYTTWLNNLPNQFFQVSHEVYGHSFEGRPLSVYKISSGGFGKHAFWIDATIHAREHITTGVITYIINELLSNSTAYMDIIRGVDFYFAPFINPDGFVYTHEVDRLFRRTRSNWTNSTCVGVDANRNFGFQFGGQGSSSNPCSETYRGPAAYSEPETDAVKDYITFKQGQNISFEAFITLHSYSQLWMSPYGYTEAPPEDYPELKQLADEAVSSLTSHFGTRYTVGNAGDVLCS